LELGPFPTRAALVNLVVGIALMGFALTFGVISGPGALVWGGVAAVAVMGAAFAVSSVLQVRSRWSVLVTPSSIQVAPFRGRRGAQIVTERTPRVMRFASVIERANDADVGNTFRLCVVRLDGTVRDLPFELGSDAEAEEIAVRLNEVLAWARSATMPYRSET
jgi:hypothetical protein